MNAYETVIGALRGAGHRVDERNGRVQAQCPAHDDGRPSLSIRRIEGQLLVHCFAGCDTAEVLRAVGLQLSNLYDDPWGATYSYPDGRRVHRTPDKKFRQSGNTKDRSLFHADRIGDASTVYVVEGEKDCLAVESAGGAAVCSAMGAGKAHFFDWEPLRGKVVVIIADRDEPGRKHANQVAGLLDGIARSVRIVEAAEGKDFSDHYAAGHSLEGLVGVAEESPKPKLTRLADVVPESVTWLWPGWLPAGKLATLDGDPGLGKSTLAVDIAARITTGEHWPDGTPCARRGDVILLSAEDGLSDTIRPRVDAAGADVKRVHAFEGVPLVGDDGEVVLRPPTLADISELESCIVRTKAALVVVDVLMAYLPTGADAHKDQDIRRVLSRLSALAERTNCTVLLLRHLNKAKGGDPLYRGGGSIGIVGAARSGLLVAADPDDPNRRVLASVKSNLGPAPYSLTYRLVDANHLGVARVQWEGVTEHTARTLLANPDLDGDSGAATEAEHWLLDYLTEQGAASSKTVKTEASKVGITERTLQRAVKTLAVVVESRGFPRITWWTLPSRANLPKTAPGTQNLGATGATGDDLHKQFGATGPKTQSRQVGESGATEAATPPALSLGITRTSPRQTGPPGDLSPPGGLTSSSPGQTDRVQQILAKHQPTRTCPHCDTPVPAGHVQCQPCYQKRWTA